MVHQQWSALGIDRLTAFEPAIECSLACLSLGQEDILAGRVKGPAILRGTFDLGGPEGNKLIIPATFNVIARAAHVVIGAPNDYTVIPFIFELVREVIEVTPLDGAVITRKKLMQLSFGVDAGFWRLRKASTTTG